MVNRAPRDTYNYALKQGRKIVYHGVTNDPVRREQEHANSGKKFSHMVISPARSHDRAYSDERASIETYQNGHGGKRPRYNKM